MRSTIDCRQLYCSPLEAAICWIIASTSARLIGLAVVAPAAAVVAAATVPAAAVPAAVGPGAGVLLRATGLAADVAASFCPKTADMMLPNTLIVSSSRVTPGRLQSGPHPATNPVADPSIPFSMPLLGSTTAPAGISVYLQDFRARTVETHRVVPARHCRQAVRYFAVAAAELDGDRAPPIDDLVHLAGGLGQHLLQHQVAGRSRRRHR